MTCTSVSFASFASSVVERSSSQRVLLIASNDSSTDMSYVQFNGFSEATVRKRRKPIAIDACMLT